jgi:murein DD-endopeptidase MepM/ murein hydrolase activator NlpD
MAHQRHNREMGRLAAIDARLFARREIILRSEHGVSYLRLSSGVQRTIAAVMMASLASVAWLVDGQQSALRLLDDKVGELARIEEAYRTAVESLGSIVDGDSGNLENFGALTKLADQNENLRKQMAELETRLNRADDERARAAEAQEALAERLRLTDRAARSEKNRQNALNGSVEQLEKQLDEAKNERTRLAQERDRLNQEKQRLAAEITDMEKRQQNLVSGQHEAFAQVIERTRGGIEALHKMIARTGLDPERFAPGGSGTGGPFVGAPNAAKESGTITAAALGGQITRLEELKRVARALPVMAPVERPRIASPFGLRTDPFNGRPAMHNGVDIAAPNRSPVLSTAPGTVVFAGRSGDFGTMVEIDHGYGIRTRYGHLSKHNVKVGQKVGVRHNVGLIGSSGRSTGPHLHYEVIYDGKNLDPVKFLEAGKHVLKG